MYTYLLFTAVTKKGASFSLSEARSTCNMQECLIPSAVISAMYTDVYNVELKLAKANIMLCSPLIDRNTLPLIFGFSHLSSLYLT